MIKRLIFALFALTILLISCTEKNKKQQDKKESLKHTEDSLSYANKRYKEIYDSINAYEKTLELQKALRKQLGKKGINGCVLIRQAGIDLVKRCQEEHCKPCKEQNPIESTSIFQLASLSKTFTAVAVLKLVEDKKLLLTDSVQKFYPNFPYHGVTIKNMLGHRSGLPNYLYSFDDSSKYTGPPSNQQIMKWLEKAKPKPYGKPDRKFSYNNSNYAVLAAVIEKVTNNSYAHYLRETIFKPLKMKDTYVINNIPDSIYATHGHERRRIVPKDYFDDIVGDKGVYSSLDDLLKWYESLTKNQLLKKESLELAFTPQSFEKKGVRNYGLGFRMILEKGTKTPKYIYHNGWWKGYSTLFWFSPKLEALIIILSNERNKSVYKTKGIINILEKTIEK